ncbi:hypothetical protein [Scytonema millei]|nr:hypothetical protein [Scytonema millei]
MLRELREQLKIHAFKIHAFKIQNFLTPHTLFADRRSLITDN